MYISIYHNKILIGCRFGEGRDGSVNPIRVYTIRLAVRARPVLCSYTPATLATVRGTLEIAITRSALG